MFYFVFKVYHCFTYVILICYILTYIYEYMRNKCKIQTVDAMHIYRQAGTGWILIHADEWRVYYGCPVDSYDHSSPRCYPPISFCL